ncbi:acyltransferase family protein [Saccharothrix carnea]|nr:acyltransferase [Saccharothrix carnea]
MSDIGTHHSRLPSLTGLRFPAALLVFVFHAAMMDPEVRIFDDATATAFASVASHTGALGVSFFFVLSGFVLAWSSRERDTPVAFWRRRFVKIYPNYVVAWLLALLLFAGTYTPVWRAIANLFMLHVWSPDFMTHFSVDPPSWSLGVEAFFYLLFPLLLLGAKRIAPERLMAWVAGTVACVIAVPLVAYTLVPAAGIPLPGAEDTSTVQYWFVYLLPPSRLLDFALGILVARAVRAGRFPRVGLVPAGLLLAASYAVSLMVPHLYAHRAVFTIPIVLLIVAAAQSDVRERNTFLSGRTMVWLGEISFAFYLLHYIVLAFGRKLLGDQLFSAPVGTALLVVMLGVSVLASWALYAWVERPITRRWSKPRTRRTAEPVPRPEQTVHR